MKITIKIILIVLLFGLLVCIRFFEKSIFYDPLLAFYQGDYLKDVTPDFNLWKLVLSTAFRYGLNTFLSLLILYIAFKDKGILKFSIVLYLMVFVILMVIFAGMLFHVEDIQNFMPLFYVRRFLIQPLLIILLLPAFYYFKKQQG